MIRVGNILDHADELAAIPGLVYTDPPWTQAWANRFARGAQHSEPNQLDALFTALFVIIGDRHGIVEMGRHGINLLLEVGPTPSRRHCSTYSHGIKHYINEYGPAGPSLPAELTGWKAAAWLIENNTQSGDTVIDPFAGNGGIGAICKRLGRRYEALELDPVRAARAEQRIQEKP